MSANSIKLLTGNSHPELAKLVADRCVLLRNISRLFDPRLIAIFAHQTRYRIDQDYGPPILQPGNQCYYWRKCTG